MRASQMNFSGILAAVFIVAAAFPFSTIQGHKA